MTLASRDGVSVARVHLRAATPEMVQVAERDVLAAADRYRMRDSSAMQGTAVRTREAEVRVEQAAFRDRVGERWGWRCAITGETVREVRDAAHLPGTSWRAGDNKAMDGILLRADLHRLLDAGILRIADGVVRVSRGNYAASMAC